jgi:hypothetical protein
MRARVFGPTATCTGDLNDDSQVDGLDLGILLSAWGACGVGTCVADLNQDGQVDGQDLGVVLSAWGSCP